MTDRILISGSVAFDTIMVFEGHFKDHILPDRVHMLNVAFLTPELKREFGGCAANIGYNLEKLGGTPVLLATIGHDGVDYLRRMQSMGLETAHIAQLPEQFTAQAFITTDLADNQIIAFHPGAMAMAHQISVADALPAKLGIVSPNGKQAMQQHAHQFLEAGIPFIFDPGQGLPMFDGTELRALIASASAVTVNDYEARLLCEGTGWNEQQIAEQLDALVITLGAEGSQVWTRSGMESIAACAISNAADPTGCGDAFRAGLLYGVSNGWSWEDASRLGSVLGAVKIESKGAQNHEFDRAMVAARFAQNYGRQPW